MKKKELEEEVERYKKSRKWFAFYYVSSAIVMVLLVIPMLPQPPTLNYDKEDFEYQVNVSFDFDDLNEKEISNVKGMIEDLEPEYVSLIKNIKFTKNMSELDRNDNITIGTNTGGDIKILYTGTKRDKEVLCHEIWHSIVQIEGEREEWYVDDLDRYGVCYKGG